MFVIAGKDAKKPLPHPIKQSPTCKTPTLCKFQVFGGSLVVEVHSASSNTPVTSKVNLNKSCSIHNFNSFALTGR